MRFLYGDAYVVSFASVSMLYVAFTDDNRWEIRVETVASTDDYYVLERRFNSRSDADAVLAKIPKAIRDSLSMEDSYGVRVDGSTVTVLR